MIKKAENWNDYECIDAGDFEKLERWKEVILRRPDPLAIWPKNKKVNWNQYDAIYHRSKSGGGSWSFNRNYRIIGPSAIKIYALKFLQLALNTRDYSLNKLLTGIGCMI